MNFDNTGKVMGSRVTCTGEPLKAKLMYTLHSTPNKMYHTVSNLKHTCVGVMLHIVFSVVCNGVCLAMYKWDLK